MSQSRPLVINQEMRESIEIKNFIYHILITSADEVDYLTEVQLNTSQKDFFKDMIAESSRGTKYNFVNPDNGIVKSYCDEILEDTTNVDKFIETSGKVAQLFKANHDNRMADGIIVVTTFTMEVNLSRKLFIALIKLDYKPVLQQVRNETDPTKVTFKEITDSLLEEKSAIQKRAIIDVENCFDWDVIAVEKNSKVSAFDTDSALGIHFKNFLEIRLLMDNSAQTRKAISQITQWARKEENVDHVDCKAKVISFINAHNDQTITLDDLKTLVCYHESQDVVTALQNSFDSHMDEANFSGAQFVAKPDSIPDSERRTKVKTNTNVTIEWLGSKDEAGLDWEETDDGVVIKIKAQDVQYVGK